MFGLTKKEMQIFAELSTPIKIQDFLNAIPINYEKNGIDTFRSPRRVLRDNKAHCIEGAAFAATALWIHGFEPLLIDMVPLSFDEGHVIAPYQINGYWGAISKTNHATLRFRDPVYENVRELIMSYFHEFSAIKNGVKTLRSYSDPMNLKPFGTVWITDENDLWHIDTALNAIPHHSVMPKKNASFIRLADAMERKAGDILEWSKDDPKTW